MAKGQKKQKQCTIDWDIFEGLCSTLNTRDDICNIFDIGKDALLGAIKAKYDTDFQTVYKKFSAGGKASLRSTQFRVANSGNPTMLIWLGKQCLDQSDKQHISLEKIEPLIIETSREQITIDLVDKADQKYIEGNEDE